jgi:hypothetical protein
LNEKDITVKHKPIQSFFLWQAAVLFVFLGLTITNEFLDLPHLLLGDTATTWNQRSGEICIEIAIFIAVVSLEVYLFMKLNRRIRLLEGLLPICASCKKIRSNDDQWEHIESYISKRSPVQFSHALCPDCLEKLYPEFSEKHV